MPDRKVKATRIDAMLERVGISKTILTQAIAAILATVFLAVSGQWFKTVGERLEALNKQDQVFSDRLSQDEKEASISSGVLQQLVSRQSENTQMLQHIIAMMQGFNAAK